MSLLYFPMQNFNPSTLSAEHDMFMAQCQYEEAKNRPVYPSYNGNMRYYRSCEKRVMLATEVLRTVRGRVFFSVGS